MRRRALLGAALLLTRDGEVLKDAPRDRPDLGLRIARRQDLSLLGPLALAIENSPTVADALACSTRYLFVHAPAMRITSSRSRNGPGMSNRLLAVQMKSTDDRSNGRFR